MKKKVTVGAAIGGIVVLCLILSACPVTSQNCAAAVNRYANTLDAVANGAKTLHDEGKVNDNQYRQVLEGEKAAITSGKELDQAILLADTGADPSKYVDLAQKSYDDLKVYVGADPVTKASLDAVVKTAGAALDNAITLIRTLRDNKAAAGAVKTGSNKPSPRIPWAFYMPLFGMAAIGALGGIAKAAQLLSLVADLEPIAFNLIVNFATSLKGKTTQELVTMNEAMFAKTEALVDSELAKLPPKS